MRYNGIGAKCTRNNFTQGTDKPPLAGKYHRVYTNCIINLHNASQSTIERIMIGKTLRESTNIPIREMGKGDQGQQQQNMNANERGFDQEQSTRTHHEADEKTTKT